MKTLIDRIEEYRSKRNIETGYLIANDLYHLYVNTEEDKEKGEEEFNKKFEQLMGISFPEFFKIYDNYTEYIFN